MIAKRQTCKSAKDLIEGALALRYFQPEKGGVAIPYRWVPSKGPLVVITGENAGGKSFMRRLLTEIARINKVEPIPISMEGRRQVAYNIGLTFVYGSEDYEATGVNSIRTVTTGISTCQGRENPHVIIWDEPDLGLSEGNAASVGSAIASFADDAPTHTRAVIVITHRKALVQELLRVKPHYLYLGDADGPESLQGWVLAPPVIRPLADVQRDAHKRFLAINKILNDVRKKNRT